jgi:two-component system chemotaxis response regulator CheB
MGKIRILLVDDSVVVRRLLTDVLNGDPMLEVAGTAPNGVIALAKLPQINPDLVILDVEMPEMDGLATLAALRKTYRRLPVIMFSRLTQRGATATLDALALGANDYVTKPTNVGSVAAAMQRIREQLIPKVKALCGRGATPALPPAAVARPAASRPLPATGRVEAVIVGASTGGPNALAEVLPSLPGNLPVPVLIVQHMPPMFTRLLAGRLDTQSALRVAEGAHGEKVEAGCVWIAPGDYHMQALRDGAGVRLHVRQGPPENSCRPAVDVLFRSAAATYGPGVLAVVLTGMGQDGLRGAEAVREAGGQVIAQDEATSVVWGMPGFVARAGLTDRVLPLADVGAEIVARVRKGRAALRAGV